MSKTTDVREQALRKRPEVARLRAVGGITRRVLVDGSSIVGWCERVGADLVRVLEALRAAAEIGRREVVLVLPVSVGALAWPAPHVRVNCDLNVSELLRDPAVLSIKLPSRPSVLVAGLDRDPQLLDSLSVGATNVLDIASGRLSEGYPFDKYDVDFANEQARYDSSSAAALADAIAATPSVNVQAAPLVVAAWHRGDDGVVLEEVVVDDGVRRRAVGHDAAVSLVASVVLGPTVAVVLSGLDVLDALRDAGKRLPSAVENPATACLVLDPDRRLLPPGLGGPWSSVLGRRGDRGPRRGSLDRLLDELPGVHAELGQRLTQEALASVYQDVCLTAPVLASIEREGFYVDLEGLERDVAHVLAEMNAAWNAIVSGPRAHEFRRADLLHESKKKLALLIRWVDGDLPLGWRTPEPSLERYAACGVPRAAWIVRLRALDSVYGWMKRIAGKARLRSVLEPVATGRMYPHGEALATIPKHIPEAMLLRRHLVAAPGHVLVGGDFASIEPRLLAHQSGDAALVAGSQPGHDLYASLMPLLSVSTRDLAKSALLALIFGRSRKSFAAQLPVPLSEGHRIFGALEGALPEAIAFRKHVMRTDTVMARSLGGWRRVRGDDSPAKFARQAFNLRMQGSASDLLRKLLRDLAASAPPDARLVHQEFDAVILSCPAAMVQQVRSWLKATMEGVARLRVPLVAKVTHGATLADLA